MSARTEWQERTSPAAGDPVDDSELRGHELVGRGDVRDGALGGVGGLNDRAGGEAGSAAGARQNPPLTEGAGVGDGGLSASGGAAGGARGNAGSSDAGAGGPDGESAGAGEYKGTSRFDYDVGSRPDEQYGEVQ